MKKATLGMFVLAMAVTGLSGVVACSSDSVATPTTSGARIKAAQGGTVSDPSGTATLTIPPGALDKDTDITLKVSAASGDALTSVYDFGPNGTTFKVAAKLDIKAAASLAPADATLAIGMGSGGTFQALEGSTFANGVVSAPVPHFTGFTVIAVGGEPGTDGGTDTSTDTGTDVVTGGDCAFKGTYTMEKYMCGTTDITASWKSVIPVELMVVTDRAGGGCSMQMTHTSTGVCVEGELFEATAPSGTTYQLQDKGVTSCSPASCKFTANDAPCVVGDRAAAAGPATIVAEGAKFHLRTATVASDICGGQEADLLFAP